MLQQMKVMIAVMPAQLGREDSGLEGWLADNCPRQGRTDAAA